MSEIHSPLALSVFDKLVHPEAKKTIKEVIPTAPDDAIDLIEKCLVFRPSSRITAAAALEHPFVREFHDPEKELPCSRKMNMPLDDNKKLQGKYYRETVLQIIKKKNEEIRERRREEKYQDKVNAEAEEEEI